MAAKNGLQEAITLLIQNQALFQSEMTQAFREMREMKEKLDTIEKILIQHSQILAGLPEAIRQKVGFKSK
ncbi:MAG TPA: hypothetical protein VGQ81_15620 [Acidobacteriota bacterium]|jgi:hypothetical protein|nr:hypothetical protein [Acidobacteriota bacterium]